MTNWYQRGNTTEYCSTIIVILVYYTFFSKLIPVSTDFMARSTFMTFFHFLTDHWYITPLVYHTLGTQDRSQAPAMDGKSLAAELRGAALTEAPVSESQVPEKVQCLGVEKMPCFFGVCLFYCFLWVFKVENMIYIYIYIYMYVWVLGGFTFCVVNSGFLLGFHRVPVRVYVRSPHWGITIKQHSKFARPRSVMVVDPKKLHEF